MYVCVIRSKKENKEVKKKGGGFTKLCSLSPQLQKFTGVPELARTEVFIIFCRLFLFYGFVIVLSEIFKFIGG